VNRHDGGRRVRRRAEDGDRLVNGDELVDRGHAIGRIVLIVSPHDVEGVPEHAAVVIDVPHGGFDAAYEVRADDSAGAREGGVHTHIERAVGRDAP
jgi:hypothetical protein